MIRKICAVIMVVICLFYIFPVHVSAAFNPYYFDPTGTLTAEMIQSVFSVFGSLLGLNGDMLDRSAAFNNSPFGVGWGTTIEDWMDLANSLIVSTAWANIKDYFEEDGTITYSDGNTVPRWKLRITSENVNDVKLFAKTIQDFSYEYYLDQQSSTWTDIDHIYGSYLSYAPEFVGTYVNFFNASNAHSYIIGDASASYHYRAWGYDLYKDYLNGSYSQVFSFNPDNDTVTCLNDPWVFSIYGRRNAGCRYYLVYPFSVSNPTNVTLYRYNTGKTNNGNVLVNWGPMYVLNSTQYTTWVNGLSNANNSSITPYPSGYVLSTGPTQSTDTVSLSGGNFYFVGELNIRSGNNTSGASLATNKAYYITNGFNITFEDNSIYDVLHITGIARPYSWSVDITDSGTGTTTTVPDAVSTVEPGVFDVGSVLYFPGYIANVPELVEVLNGDAAITGEIAGENEIDPDNPSDPSNESVTIDIVPPSALGLDSIWHYVADTYTYVADYISVMVNNVFTIIPTPITNCAFAAVVLGILFGLYKRFIE